MPNILSTLIDIGNTDATLPERRKWVRLSNISSLLSMLGFFVHAVAFCVIGAYSLASLSILVAIAQLGLLYLNHHKYYQPNWLIYQFINCFFIFYFSTILGSQAQVFWFYIIVFKTSFIYSFGRRFIWAKRLLLVYVTTLVCLDLIFKFRPFGTYVLAPDSFQFFSILEPGLCMVLMLLFIYYFINQTHKTSQKLTVQAKNLEENNIELKRLSEELDKLVYHAWHDLRAPIASAMGLINLAKGEKDIEVIQQYLNLQDKCLKKLDKLIRDLLDYKRNREMAVKTESIDFETAVEDALAACRCEDGGCGVDFEIIIDQNGEFVSDQTRLDMILKNLISNAIRYSKLDDIKPQIKVEIKSLGDQAKIIVQDQGIGIREDLHDRIFEMFFRGSNQSEGTGLGLYIVNETAQKLGGKVHLDSTVGEGSIFEVSIPNLVPTDHLVGYRPKKEAVPAQPEFA